MASRGGYDGGSGAGGKIRRRPPSRAAAASPYARPAPAPAPSPAPAASGGEGSGWLTRIIAGGASRLLSSVFRKLPPQLAAPPSRPETLDALPSRPDSVDAPTSQLEPLDAPPSPPPPPPPPPLEDDVPEGSGLAGAIANKLSADNLNNSVNDGVDILRHSDGDGAMGLEELLKQRTFTRSEFEYLAELLRSRTVGSDTVKPEASNIKQLCFPEKRNGSRDLPADFSTRSYSVVDQIASPAELAKAYMGSRPSGGPPLRLRLHDTSCLPIKSIESSTLQLAKPSTLSLLPSSRLHASTPSDRIGSNYTTPNRSAIYKMSSSPYFKSAASSRDFSGSVPSSYQPPSSVHTFGRQVLKRKSTALNDETVSVGPIRKMRQRYNRVSPLLETRPGNRGYLSSRASKPDKDFEHSSQTQKGRCLDKVGDGTRGAVDSTTCGNSFGQAPAQSTEMAARILKQLDALVPLQKEVTSETRQNHQKAMDADDSTSQKVLAQGSLLESSFSGVKEYSLHNITGASKFTPAAKGVITAHATSDRSAVLNGKSASEIVTSPKDSLELDNSGGSTKIVQANRIEKSQSLIPEHIAKTNNDKPPAFSLKSHAPSNLALFSEIDRNKVPASTNGFSFPVPAAFGTHSQAPPTPTMASPPLLPVEKQQPSAVSNAPVTSVESVPRIFEGVSEEGSNPNRSEKKMNAINAPISSKSSVQAASFTSNPVFSVVNSKPATLSNGVASKSTASAVFSYNGSNNSVLSTNSGSSAASTPQFSFQSAFQTSTTSAQQSAGIQFKAEPAATPFSAGSTSSGGAFTLLNTGPGSSSTSSGIFSGTISQSVTTPSLASSHAGNGNAAVSFSPQFGSARLLAAEDKSKTGSSSTTFNFSPQFGSANSFASLDKPKATLPESTLLSGNQGAQSGNSNMLTTQGSSSNSNLISSEKSNSRSSPSFATLSFGSATLGSTPSSSSSLFSFAVGSGSTTASLPSPAMSSAFGSGAAFSTSPIISKDFTATAPPSFGLPNTASAMSPVSSTSSPVFSFTSATPTIANSSPSTPIFGIPSPSFGLVPRTDQLNGGQIIEDKNQSPFSTGTPFGLPSSSPSTPVFSTPSTQFTSTTAASPGIFQFAQQSQASPVGFSIGSSDGTSDKSNRKFIRVKRKK